MDCGIILAFLRDIGLDLCFTYRSDSMICGNLRFPEAYYLLVFGESHFDSISEQFLSRDMFLRLFWKGVIFFK